MAIGPLPFSCLPAQMLHPPRTHHSTHTPTNQLTNSVKSLDFAIYLVLDLSVKPTLYLVKWIYNVQYTYHGFTNELTTMIKVISLSHIIRSLPFRTFPPKCSSLQRHMHTLTQNAIPQTNLDQHNIIQIHNNVTWDWNYSIEYSLILSHSIEHGNMKRMFC